MGLIARLKRLWRLSGEPEVFRWGHLKPTDQEVKMVKAAGPVSEGDLLQEVPQTQKRMATVVQDDPMDIFQSDEPTDEQPTG
jgi:hypothetical protein